MYFYTYILASRRNSTIYTGSTDDLLKRVVEHQESCVAGSPPSMASRAWSGSNCTARDEAFRRERQIKEWKRVWKLDLIERRNPSWDDLLPTLL